ncbi:MAG: hypothetical protein LBP51_02805 [Deferribacteraceae bacterium]|jgi:hypothetical protein|nr:hypothetical protein [Deferribacteraceae bacterium]
MDNTIIDRLNAFFTLHPLLGVLIILIIFAAVITYRVIQFGKITDPDKMVEELTKQDTNITKSPDTITDPSYSFLPGNIYYHDHHD